MGATNDNYYHYYAPQNDCRPHVTLSGSPPHTPLPPRLSGSPAPPALRVCLLRKSGADEDYACRMHSELLREMCDTNICQSCAGRPIIIFSSFFLYFFGWLSRAWVVIEHRGKCVRTRTHTHAWTRKPLDAITKLPICARMFLHAVCSRNWFMGVAD